jgi:hypothetical protein
MIKDEEDCFEDLAKSYPELMEKSRIGEVLGVGVGWFNIIDTLCGCLYASVAHAKGRLKAATDYPRNDGGKYLAESEAACNQEIENLPVIVQIKEKFAGLRFYTDYCNDRADILIQFAESMSRRTCEECGNPGELDNAGWMKTYCKDHKRRPDEDDLPNDGRVSAKFQDGDV